MDAQNPYSPPKTHVATGRQGSAGSRWRTPPALCCAVLGYTFVVVGVMWMGGTIVAAVGLMFRPEEARWFPFLAQVGFSILVLASGYLWLLCAQAFWQGRWALAAIWFVLVGCAFMALMLDGLHP